MEKRKENIKIIFPDTKENVSKEKGMLRHLKIICMHLFAFIFQKEVDENLQGSIKDENTN